MGVKIKKQLQILSLIERSREDFKSELQPVIGDEVVSSIEKGNSPIKSGKYAKYSESYLKAIAGPKKTRATTQGAQSALKYGKNGKSKKTSKVSGSGLGAKYGKLKSPVNLRLTGALMDSITSKKTPNGVEVAFTDPKAEFHNEGVPSKGIPSRRLLPNKTGEEFNTNILRRIIDALKKAVKKNS